MRNKRPISQKNRHCQTPPLTPDIWKNGCIWQLHLKNNIDTTNQALRQESLDLDCKSAPTCAKKILNFIFQHCTFSYSFRILSSTLTFFPCIFPVLQSSQPSRQRWERSFGLHKRMQNDHPPSSLSKRSHYQSLCLNPL